MLLPINWLKDYVDVDETIKTITVFIVSSTST